MLNVAPVATVAAVVAGVLVLGACIGLLLRGRVHGWLASLDRVCLSLLIALVLLSLYVGMGMLSESALEQLLHLPEDAVLLAPAVLVALTFMPIFSLLQRLLDRALYRDAYDYSATLHRFSQEFATIRSQDDVISTLLDGVVERLNLRGAAYVSLPEGPGQEVLPVLEAEDLWARREFATEAGRQRVLAGLRAVRWEADRPARAAALREHPWPGCAALLVVARGANPESAGLLILGEKVAGGPLRRRDRALLLTLANHAGTALANAELVQGLRISLAQVQISTTQLVAAREELRLLLEQLVSADERQRAALARDLHDDALQDVLYMVRHTQLCMRLARALEAPPDDQPDAARAAERASQLTRLQGELAHLAQRSGTAERKLRRLCLGLYPELLHSLGLAVALEDLAEQMAEARVRCTVKCAPDAVEIADTLPAHVALHIYRIAQEATRNAARHAGSPWARVSLTVARDAMPAGAAWLAGRRLLLLEVRDGGQGMALPVEYGTLLQHGHLGLAGMRERAHLVGGWLQFERTPTGGTSVRLWVPVPVEAERERVPVPQTALPEEVAR